MMFLVYSKCLETYYIMHKERDLLEVHKTVGTALAQGNKEDERAWKVMERTNISMLVLQDNQVIFLAERRSGTACQPAARICI